MAHLHTCHTYDLIFITPSPLMEVGVPSPGNHKQLSDCVPLIGVQVALVQSLCLNIGLLKH